MEFFKAVKIFIILLIMFSVFSCNKSKNSGKIKIGFLLKTMQEERYSRDRKYFTEKAESLGAVVIFDSANNREQTQLEKFENMLAQGCKVIVLQPVNTGTAGSLVEMAHAEGVKVIGYDSLLLNGPIDFMVMQDSWEVGRLQAQAMIDWLRNKKGKVEGNVVLIEGQPGDSNANAMSSGAIEVIDKYPDVKVLTRKSHDSWSPDLAMSSAENILTKYGYNIDAFICNNSGLCRGVIAALDNVGMANSYRIFTAGADADLVNIQYVADGKQTVEVWKKIKPLAEKAAEVAVKMAENPNKHVYSFVSPDTKIYNGYFKVPVIITQVVLITKDNINDTVIKDKFYSAEQVYSY